MTQLEALEKAIEKAGGQAALARLVGTSQQNINNMLVRGYCSSGFVKKVAKKTGVAREHLRPDLY